MVNASSLVTEPISSSTSSFSSPITSMSMTSCGTTSDNSSNGTTSSATGSTNGAVRYCNRCMKVLPIDHFMKGTMIRKSCGGCRERNRLRFAQQKAERSVARESIPVTLDGVAGYVRASLLDARRSASPLHPSDDDVHQRQSHRSRRPASPLEQEASFHMLFKVSLMQEPVLRRATPRVIADAVVHRVGEGDGYAWQPGASYVNADNTIAQTFHYRCSLRTDPAKRRNNCHGGSDGASATRSMPAWRFLDCYNCGGLVKVAIATDHSYAVVTIDHRMLHRRPSQRGIVSSSSSIPSSIAVTTSVFNSGQTTDVSATHAAAAAAANSLQRSSATPIAQIKSSPANSDTPSWPTTPSTPVSSKPTTMSAPVMAHPMPQPLWIPTSDSIWPVNPVSPMNQMMAAQAELLAAQSPTSLSWPHSPMTLMTPSSVTTPVATPLPSPRLFNATGVTLLLQHLIQQQQQQRLTPSSTVVTPNLPARPVSSLAVPPLPLSSSSSAAASASSGVGIQTPMLYNASTPMEFPHDSAASIPTTPLSPLGAYPFPIMTSNHHNVTTVTTTTTADNSITNSATTNDDDGHLTTPGTSPSPSSVAATSDDGHSADAHNAADNTSLLLRHIASSFNQEPACPPITEQQFMAAMQQWQSPSSIATGTPSSFTL
ncbi:hypothetical protein BDF22DRAFT_363458 [Syncephalis plumigaleata]|nr:hypothetical protein BDF22DRAFT_363458 [Syncephalis plumigaleata]